MQKGGLVATAGRERLFHAALDSAPGDGPGLPVAEARLSDRQRVAVVLQAASLLSHLEVAGCRLASGWDSARVDARGLLRDVAGENGRDRSLPQERLSELGILLFRAERRIAGRGQARRVVRALLRRWRQALTRIAPDQAVRHVLDEADFLWKAEFADARTTLVAELRGSTRQRLWVAGPGWFRRALLGKGRSRQEIEDLLASNDLQQLWHRLDDRPDPRRLSVAGRWRAAVQAWEDSPPQSADEKLQMARALYALGRFEDARLALHRLRNTDARILRAWCDYWLGRLGPARRGIRALGERRLESGHLIETARVAVRVLANTGDGAAAEEWVARTLERLRGERRFEAELLAASAAWDRHDDAEVDRRLHRARPALDVPDLAWRWHRVAGWRAMRQADGPAVVEHFRAALASRRRQLLPFEAAGLWNELAIGRSMVGDLAGAERALVHAARLHGETQGPRQTTLAHFNLAEIRLRRGRLTGVRDILERATTENLRAGNRRGGVHDAALWARFELVRGRPAAALARVRAVLDELDEKGLEWQVSELRAIAGRALGWLERPAGAFIELEQTSEETRAQFEPEERPALWALAGDRERALEEVVEGAAARLWRALLTGRRPVEKLWRCLDQLEDYRAARLVFDAELIAPGSAPPGRIRWAARVLRGLGASAFAERLETADSGPWRAVERFLRLRAPGVEDIEALFSTAGLGDVGLRWASEGREVEILGNSDGGESISVRHADGRLIAYSPRIDTQADPILHALLRVVSNHWAIPPLAKQTRSQKRPAAADGIVGESQVLVEALDRATKLAHADMPILILGETGTGKELIAKRIHATSDRSGGPFVPFNCAAVSEQLLMSDLFGHVRGAFTGADRDRHGVFEAARRGTVFLDEIGDLPLGAQGFLLRVLQEGEVRRVGESLPRTVDVRVVAATHRDLAEMVSEGSFREDLFFRLKVASVELPPLRRRDGDVLLLARHFLRQARPGEEIGLSASARSALSSHAWPGNVRELRNVLVLAVALSESALIRRSHLELPETARAAGELGYHELVFNYRRRLVRDALASSAGNQAEAARRLGMTRQALSYLVKKLGIET